jgi:hypothetical protein
MGPAAIAGIQGNQFGSAAKRKVSFALRSMDLTLARRVRSKAPQPDTMIMESG